MKSPFILLILICLPTFTFSQNSLEATIGAGASIVDIETLVEKDEISGSSAEDWNVFTAGISIQGFFYQLGAIQFGGELMYQYLYWYSVRVPFGTTPIYREYDVDATKISAITRFGGDGKFNLDVGPQINFTGGTMLGLLLSANYNLSINDKMDIPLKMRIDILNNVVITAPVTLHGGIRIKL